MSTKIPPKGAKKVFPVREKWVNCLTSSEARTRSPDRNMWRKISFKVFNALQQDN
jgi:hypothetical protein